MWWSKLFTRAFLGAVRNTIVKIIPENSWLFKQITIAGLKINAKKGHLPLQSLVMGVFATQHCNLNCKCCTTFSPIAEECFLDVETYNNDMEKLAKITANKLTSFYVTGGEPLLHPRLTEIFDIARLHFPETPISFMTNGLLLLKMPEVFWENCNKNNATISLSRYPINIDIDSIKTRANNFGVNFKYVGGDGVPVKKMWKYPLDLTGKQPLSRGYDICSQINLCITMDNGKIYPCNTISNIKHFNKYFNKKLEITSGDFLELRNVGNINEIYEFLCAPKPFCRYCNRKGIKLGIKFGSSKREITEWV